MGNGNWLIFHIPQDDFGFADVSFSPELLDSLKAAGYTGGRLHWQARDLVDPVTHLIDTGAVSYMSWIMDELSERDMAVCFQYDCLTKEEPDSMGAVAKSKYFTTWEQLCMAFKDKSHNIAMCPVIEFHGWQYLKVLYTDTKDERYLAQMYDSTNWFYNECTKIFRTYNPTRIISYKPWGSAKRMEFHTLDFPFDGNHPNPDSGYYVASGSGSYGMGEWSDYGVWSTYTLDDLKWQAVTAGLGKPEFGIHYGVQWREQTGIQFWVDHWEPATWHRPGEWTDEQNLAYTDFFLDTLQALGISSSGPQTRRFWDNDKSRFMSDHFSQDFLRISARHCWRGPLVYPPGDTAGYQIALRVVGEGHATLAPEMTHGEYARGTVVVLSAIPDPGWEFVGWLGDLEGNANPAEIVVSSNHSLQAIFRKVIGEMWSTDTLLADADAFVQFNKPDENFGNQNNMVIKSTYDFKFNRNGLIRFDLSEIEGEIYRAELHLTCKKEAGDSLAMLSVYSVTDDAWMESGVTWNNAPEAINFLDQVANITSVNAVHKFNVTPFVILELEGDKIMSVKVLDGSLSGDLLQIYAREDSLYYPRLIIKEEDTTASTTIREDFTELLEVYPNPADDILYLHSLSTRNSQSEVKIIDMTGKVWYRSRMEGDKARIDVSFFSQGIYLVGIENESGWSFRKVLVNRKTIF